MPPKTTYHWKEEQVREMIALYESGMTLTEVGAEFGISKQRVEQIFKKAGFKTRHKTKTQKFLEAQKNRRVIIDRDTLVKFYIEEGLTILQMEEKLEVGFSIVRNSLVHHKIPVRLSNEYRKSSLTRELLEPLYLGEKLTADEIAARLGFAPCTIKIRLSKLGIKKDVSLRRFGKRNGSVNP
jgi:DNA-binding CsgD family transcriptional regulator